MNQPLQPIVPYRHILFPTDGSDCARHALTAAAEMARACGAEITVLHAVRSPLPAVAPSLNPSQTFSTQEIVDLVEQQARGLVDQTVTSLSESGIKANGLLSHQDPREAILEAASSQGCDLIVIGSHHRGALRRLILGSISTYTLHHAPIPVLIVPLLTQAEAKA